jgi:hypothetical protein
VDRCKRYLNAEEEAKELLIAIENNWVKMETQIQILRRVAPNLNQRLLDMQAQVLSQLEGKLKTASLTIEQLLSQKRDEDKNKKIKKANWKHTDADITTVVKDLAGMKPVTKAKLALKTDALHDVLDEIEKWQARYDPSWILIMQMSIGSIDDELHREEDKPEPNQVPIIMAAKGLRDALRANRGADVRGQKLIWIDPHQIHLNPQNIPSSTVQISDLPDEKAMVVIDNMVSNSSADMNSTMKAVRNMARLLAEVDPSTFSLLKCRGVIKVPKPESPKLLFDFKFIFNIPHGLSNPQSLRAVLLSEKLYPLDERLELAKRLTSSILFVHTVQFVHKNIRPETIIIFQNDHSEIGAPFLAGFEQFRLENAFTLLSGDDLWQHNLCMFRPHLAGASTDISTSDRHPSRQGTHPETNYQMQHDIYSLGVVLLEIGLWTSFVLEDPENGSLPFPNSILCATNMEQSYDSVPTAAENKQMLEDLAERELPSRMGRRYTDIVLLCLRCLDSGSGTGENEKGFGVDSADWTDEDGLVIGVRFIENVLEKMQEISI